MLKRLPMAAPVAAALMLFTGALALAATVTEIHEPDESYLATTTRIDISGIEDSTFVNQVSDEWLTVTFNLELFKESGWNWGSDPHVEDESPHLLMSDWADALTMTLSEPAAVFGFELRPNAPEVHDFTVVYQFAGGGSHTIQRQIAGADGARLVAVSVDGDAIEQVRISATTELGVTNDFAIAQIRYVLTDVEQATPEETLDEEQDLFEYFAEVTGNGELVGNGPGNGAAGRLAAFAAILDNAGSSLVNGDTKAACNQLAVALKRTDGSQRPPDLVEGEAAATLATLIEDAIEDHCG